MKRESCIVRELLDVLLPPLEARTCLPLKSAMRHRAEEIDAKRITPEENLLISLIKRAVLDLGLAHERADAWKYIFQGESRELMPFDVACEYLGIDPDELREHIRAHFDIYCIVKGT